jgi:tRNA splicing endonuclease
MSKNLILPKKKKAELANVENIEDLIIQKMENPKAEIIENTEGGDDEDNPQRVNFMMPRYLFDMMKGRLKRKGDKMSNYLISLVRKDLGDD